MVLFHCCPQGPAGLDLGLRCSLSGGEWEQIGRPCLSPAHQGREPAGAARWGCSLLPGPPALPAVFLPPPLTDQPAFCWKNQQETFGLVGVGWGVPFSLGRGLDWHCPVACRLALGCHTCIPASQVCSLAPEQAPPHSVPGYGAHHGEV